MTPLSMPVTETSAANPGLYDKPIKAKNPKARIQQIRTAILIDFLLIQFHMPWLDYILPQGFLILTSPTKLGDIGPIPKATNQII
jgi:hypothetical protein